MSAHTPAQNRTYVAMSARNIKTQSETTPVKCAEIKGIKSHGAPAAEDFPR